ncbi:uncharacterized protein LOC128553009 [Mercenaria mercenaria]|uniref:uncharacterized protein LOC128553009 n=1 Tax=Mercenaria mercenaria TaxID=6596 RepID=UPI00234F227A|nr:uncharacterized protein LOC128553009 [Mercenaria mercenaria]
MIVTLPSAKVHTIVQACKDLQRKTYAKIREIAIVLGLMVSSFSAVEFEPLYYRDIERPKIQALMEEQGNYEKVMLVPDEMKLQLKWWTEHLHCQTRHITHANPDIIIYSDASSFGWGGVCSNVRIGGRWSKQEARNHINYLELLAAFLAIKSFCKCVVNAHVQIKSDNSCAVSYIRNMGGCKSLQCDFLARSMWQWCIEKDIWLPATHIPGIQNEADSDSRAFNENVEWKIDKDIFTKITVMFGKPQIDMFASRMNTQLPRFVSWKSYPDAEAIDTFSLSWSDMYIYAFPPFSLMGRFVQKVRQDKAEGLLVAPLWVTQNWFKTVLEMLIDTPLIVKVQQNILTIPQSQKVHPLADKLHLMVCDLSGNPSKAETFMNSLPISSCLHGESLLRSNIPRTLTNGFRTVVKGKLILFKPL